MVKIKDGTSMNATALSTGILAEELASGKGHAEVEHSEKVPKTVTFDTDKDTTLLIQTDPNDTHA